MRVLSRRSRSSASSGGPAFAASARVPSRVAVFRARERRLAREPQGAVVVRIQREGAIEQRGRTLRGAGLQQQVRRVDDQVAVGRQIVDERDELRLRFGRIAVAEEISGELEPRRSPRRGRVGGPRAVDRRMVPADRLGVSPSRAAARASSRFT